MSRLFVPLMLFFATFLVALPTASAVVTIPTVPVGNAGNANDPFGGHLYGGVSYAYRIGTTEVTNAQYVEFLNAVAKTDTYGLYNPAMGSNTIGGITRTGSPGSYVYSIKADAGTYTYANKPVVYVSWGDAARFSNWLQNDRPMGAEGPGTTENGAYTLNGATTNAALNAVTRDTGANWFIPSENEWYKSAYYDPATSGYHPYATGANLTPNNHLPSSDTGNSANFFDNIGTTRNNSFPLTDAGAYVLSASPYGTHDQAGNVFEWNEALLVSGTQRGVRGGGWDGSWANLPANDQLGVAPTFEGSDTGFRVASVPEPGTAVLAILALGFIWVLRKRLTNR